MCCLLGLCWLGVSSGGEPGAWLNAKDFGASGSEFETAATTTAGSNQIVVENVGDFRAGQGVMVSKCNVRYSRALIRGPGQPYGPTQKFDGKLDLRGFDGSGGDWLVFLLDIDGSDPLTFRWSDDLGRSWKGSKVPVTYDWQKLSGGLEAKFHKWEWQPGHFAAFSARTQLVTTIDKIDGHTLTLKRPANKSVSNALVRHCDSAALQRCVNAAIRQKRHVYVPRGHYRLSYGVTVRDASVRIEGASGVDTLMDITDGIGSVFRLYRGTDVTIRHFRMIGHTSLEQRPATIRTASGFPYWCCALKPCNAVSMSGTVRILIEDVHVKHMASEAFYCHGPTRYKPREGKAFYTKSLTFLRCSVTDCAANAFNNNDTSENTSVLYCRIDGAGWHAYEGPARFIRLIGNYVRNAGPFTIGDMNHRLDHLHELGCGQAVVRGNVFEGCDGRNGGIAVHHGARQVTISDNLFVNYNGTGITVSGQTTRKSYPSQNMVVANNVIDLTHVGDKPRHRVGIRVAASDVIVSGNQIYVRGGPDPRTVGITVQEPAVNVSVHGNLVRNCGQGICTSRARSSVTQVIDERTFMERALPLEWRTSHLYRGWHLVWLSGAQRGKRAVIETLDPESCQFRLTQPQLLRVGAAFEVFPDSANWLIRGNTITGCQRPVTHEAYGGDTTLFRDNVIERGRATGVQWAVVVEGRGKWLGNHIVGFDEENASALVLKPDRLGRTQPNLYKDNIIERCFRAVLARKPGLWESAITGGNQFIDCRGAPEMAAGEQPGQGDAISVVSIAASLPSSPVLQAAKLAKPAAVDGRVDEWPWSEAKRVVPLQESPQGDRLIAPKGRLCAGWDDAGICLAMRFVKAKGAKLTPGLNWRGDGVELSIRSSDAKHPTPIFVLWGTVNGTFNGSTAMGAPADQVQRLEKGIRYAAQIADDEWTCEWRLSFDALGLPAGGVKGIKLNVGLRSMADDSWAAWVGTGGRICEVDLAGELRLTQ